MLIKVSEKAYKIKPSKEEMSKITYGMKNKPCKDVDFKELSELIKEGRSTILAEFNDLNKNIFENNIVSISCLALDIDSKENPITLYEMVALVGKKIGIFPKIEYCTFSDTNLTRFRLIYRFEMPVTAEVYKIFYESLCWKLGKYLDTATKNANRVWAGTNKDVTYRENDKPISTNILFKLIKSYQAKLKREEAKRQAEIKAKYTNEFNCKEIATYDYIKSEFKVEVMQHIINTVDLKDFIERHFGGSFKYKSQAKGYVGACPLHNGDNTGAFVITNKTYRCYTHCGSGNIFSVAKLAYKENNFSKIVFKIVDEYNIEIPQEYIQKN